MNRKKNKLPQGKQLVWSSTKYAIYKNDKLHELYIDGKLDQSFHTFDKAYKHSMSARGLKVVA